MRTTGVGRGPGRSSRAAAPLHTILMKHLARMEFGNLLRGGLAVDSRITANLVEIGRAKHRDTRRALEPAAYELALRPINGRAHLIKALVSELGFSGCPGRVVEFFSGGNLSGPLALPDSRYTTVSREPGFLSLAGLPAGFFREAGLAEIGGRIASRAFQALSSRTPEADLRNLGHLLKVTLPNLEVFQGSVQDFARIPARANQADLCLALFWSSGPFLEMEAVVRPGGYIVTIELQQKEVDKMRERAPQAKPVEQEPPRHSVVREDLMASFSDRLSSVPGYKRLRLSVTIMQRI